MYQILLIIHIAGGVLSLSAPIGALAAAKGTRWHILAGRAFVFGMFVIFATTLPMTVLKPNAFLLGVAFVSFYLALTGWLRARHRAAEPVLTDWLSASIMFLGALIISVWAFPLARGAMPGAPDFLPSLRWARPWPSLTCLPFGLIDITVSCGLLLTSVACSPALVPRWQPLRSPP
jgi:hypothetical protein